MGTVTEADPFPWSDIAVRTAQLAVVTFLTLTGLVAAARRNERRELEELERMRNRWTDEARWDR